MHKLTYFTQCTWTCNIQQGYTILIQQHLKAIQENRYLLGKETLTREEGQTDGGEPDGGQTETSAAEGQRAVVEGLADVEVTLQGHEGEDEHGGLEMKGGVSVG